MEKGHPQVDAAAEFFEIVMDFRDPRDAIREGISNAFDAGAETVRVTAEIIPYQGQDELVLTLEDDGVGMKPEASCGENTPDLKAFFSLGSSSSRNQQEKIGTKGHGTKTYFNSREIEVWTWRDGKEVYAVMSEPRVNLAQAKVPEYDWEEKAGPSVSKTGTKIVVHGYNQNRTKGFSHNELRDFIYWFTKFGSIESGLGIPGSKKRELYLRGLGQQTVDRLAFGHPFPPKEDHDLKSLRKLDPAAPTKYFVKKWCERNLPIKGYPQYFLDIVFYIEGDKAKGYNRMIRRQGVEIREGMYSVEERYGLWACKDFIPIQNVTEWVSRGQRAASTKYHAFVNCQQFKLTANRGDVGNTDERLLNSIRETVVSWFDQKVLNDPVYKRYEEELLLEVQYRKPEEEEKEHTKRKKLAGGKKVCVKTNASLLTKKQLELYEPRQEIEVYALFCMLYSLNPDLFGFKVVDYDAHRGYDALVETKPSPGLDKETLRFVEFKRSLERDFNHSFAKLAAVVCWECNLPSEEQLKDIRNEIRTLIVTKPSPPAQHTKYMLRSDSDERNIEVFVLKDYLREKCNIEFRPRT
jgi:hypothetical protein